MGGSLSAIWVRSTFIRFGSLRSPEIKDELPLHATVTTRAMRTLVPVPVSCCRCSRLRRLPLKRLRS